MGDHMSRMVGCGRDSTRDVAVRGTAVETIDIENFAYSRASCESGLRSSARSPPRYPARGEGRRDAGDRDAGRFHPGPSLRQGGVDSVAAFYSYAKPVIGNDIGHAARTMSSCKVTARPRVCKMTPWPLTAARIVFAIHAPFWNVRGQQAFAFVVADT